MSRKNPDRFIKRAGKIIRTGFGQPSVFNADLIVQELVRMGKSVEDARDGGSSGCVEVGAFGKEAFILAGYFNIPKMLELALHDGVDPRTGRQIGPHTGDPASFATFEDLFAAFLAQMRHFVEIKVRGNSVIERLYAAYMPAPFLSTLIDDCIAKGRDYHDGGPRYDTTYIQGVGIGTITDALSAIKHHVFDRQDLTMTGLLAALDADFAGYERERQLLLNRTPRYGNDDDAADALMVRVFNAFFDLIDGRKNTRGGTYHLNMLPTTCHVYFGSVIGATPDGRRAHTPLSEGISPVQGADRHGPTAVIKSAAKMDHAAHRRHATQPEVHPTTAGGRRRAGKADAAHPLLLPAGRPPHPVQRGGCRDAAPRAGPPRATSRSDRPRGGLQRLLLRPERGAAE